MRLTDGTTPVNVTIAAAANDSVAELCRRRLADRRSVNRGGWLDHQPCGRQRRYAVPHAVELTQASRAAGV